jgi:hypothetical protein
MRLYHAALDLYRHDQGLVTLHGDLAQGEVRNLKKVLPLGALTGPGFEAHIDTPHGSGIVRFLLTRQGLRELGDEVGDEASVSPRNPATLN